MYTPSDYFLYILHKSSPLPTGQLSPPGKVKSEKKSTKLRPEKARRSAAEEVSIVVLMP